MVPPLAATAPLPVHSLPSWVDVSAMAVAAAFGAAVARNRRTPLLAVLLVGIVAGLAGGMVRDVLLGLEAVAIQYWYYLPAVLVAAVVGGVVAHRLIEGRTPYLIAQGAAAGLLIAIGVQKGLAYRAPADAAILLGILAGTMGGATADVLAGERASILRQSHWLLAAIVCGSIVFWLFTSYVNFWVATVAAVLTVSSLHTSSVRLGWNSFLFPGDHDS